jgi:surface antigen
MNPHKTLSSYLVRPDLSARRQRQWAGFRSHIMQIRRYNPRLLSRTIGAVLIWTAVIVSVRYISDPHSLSQQISTATNHAAIAKPTTFQPSTPTATLASVAHAQTLPGGPSGQLLPPGTLAPDRTYANSYTRGQCTWYVASRRQVPAGWGNAVSWYYHAVASGWSVGTTPAVAAIAWTPAGSYGHVALVEQISADGSQVYISEMNYRGVGIKDYRWVSAKSFKYIY